MPTSWPKWCYFTLPENAFESLAAAVRANELLPPPSDDPKQRLSKDDILCAFFWTRLCELRLARGMPADTETKISRSINARVPLGIPSTYLGAHVSSAIVRQPIRRIAEMSVSEVTGCHAVGHAQLRDHDCAPVPGASCRHAVYGNAQRLHWHWMYKRVEGGGAKGFLGASGSLPLLSSTKCFSDSRKHATAGG